MPTMSGTVTITDFDSKYGTITFDDGEKQTTVGAFLPVSELLCTIQYQISDGYTLTGIVVSCDGVEQTNTIQVNFTGSGSYTLDLVPYYDGELSITFALSFEFTEPEPEPEPGPTNPVISSLSDANGNTYNIADILTIKGSLGGGPWNIADINTFACGDAVYSIEHETTEEPDVPPTPGPMMYEITVDATGCTVSIDRYMKQGETATGIITPDQGYVYLAQSMTITRDDNNETVSYSEDADSPQSSDDVNFSFIMPDSDVTISVTVYDASGSGGPQEG